MRTRQRIVSIIAVASSLAALPATAAGADHPGVEGSTFTAPAIAASYPAIPMPDPVFFTCAGSVSTVTWGDGTTSDHFANGGGLGLPTCFGSITGATHVYSAPGTYTFTTNSSSNRALIADAALTGEPQSFTIPAGGTVSGTLSAFSSAWTDEPIGHFAATVGWGDGTATSTGVVSAAAGAPGRFLVTAPAHAYATGGTFTLTTTITQAGAAPLAITSTVVVQAATVAPPADATAPKLSKLTSTLKLFGPPKRRVTERVVSFTSNEPGSVTVTFERKVGRAFVALPAVKLRAASGANVLRFSRALRAKLAKSGSYRVQVVVTDAAGNASAAATRAFVVR